MLKYENLIKIMLFLGLFVMLFSNVSALNYCGDSYCNTTAGETSSTCCIDCGCSASCTKVSYSGVLAFNNNYGFASEGYGASSVAYNRTVTGNDIYVNSNIPSYASNIKFTFGSSAKPFMISTQEEFNNHSANVTFYLSDGISTATYLSKVNVLFAGYYGSALPYRPNYFGIVTSSTSFNRNYGVALTPYINYYNTTVLTGANINQYIASLNTTYNDVSYTYDAYTCGASTVDTSYFCSPQGAGSLCTTPIGINTFEYITSNVEDTLNPLVSFYNNTNDFRIIDSLDNQGGNFVGSSSYSIDTDCLELDKCISAYKNMGGNTLSFEKSIGKSLLDYSGTMMFSSFWINIPSETVSKISKIYVYYGDSDFSNYYKIEMNALSLNSDWNLITELNGQLQKDRTYITIGNPTSSSISKMKLEIVFNEYAVYTSPFVFDYVFAEKFKISKTGNEYTHFLNFDSGGIYNMTLKSQAYGQTKYDYITFNVTGGIDTNVTLQTVSTPFNVSSGGQTIYATFQDFSANNISGGTCIAQFEFSNGNSNTTINTNMENIGSGLYSAKLNYIIDGVNFVRVFCSKTGYNLNHSHPDQAITVVGANLLSYYATVHVYSDNYNHFPIESSRGTRNVCFKDMKTNAQYCCSLDDYNGDCEIQVPRASSLNPMYSSMVIDGTVNPDFRFNLLSNGRTTEGIYHTHVQYVTNPYSYTSYFSIVDETLDCSVSGYASSIYDNLTVTDKIKFNFTSCVASSCSVRYSYGYVNFDAVTQNNWFWSQGTNFAGLDVLVNKNFECDGTYNEKICTPAERFTSRDEMINKINTNFTSFKELRNRVHEFYNNIASGSYNGVDATDIKMMGSVVTCKTDCSLDITPCYGTCNLNNECEPYLQEKNLIKEGLGLITDNESNFPIMWLIFTALIGGFILIKTKNALAGGLSFMFMLIVGGSAFVLPTWLSVTMVMAMVLLFVGFLALKAFGGGGGN